MKRSLWNGLTLWHKCPNLAAEPLQHFRKRHVSENPGERVRTEPQAADSGRRESAKESREGPWATKRIRMLFAEVGGVTQHGLVNGRRGAREQPGGRMVVKTP